MTEQDREIYDKVVKLFIDRDSDEKITYTGQTYISNLLAIVKHLDKQLTEVKEAGKFLDELVQLADKDDKPDDDYWLMDCGGGKLSEIEIGQIRRLAQALNGVNDE